MNEFPEITEFDLHALIDGELDADRARTVDAAIRANPILEAQMAAYCADKAMMKRIVSPLADLPVPRDWVVRAQKGAPPARSINRRLVGAIAALFLVVVGVGTAYWETHRNVQNDVVALALEARGAAVPEQKVITVSSATDVTSYNAVLSRLLASSVRVPDLSRLNYQLVAIQLYTASAELSYHDKVGRLFTLYLHRSDGKARFDQFPRDGLRVCVWQDDQISMVMAGNISVAEMQKLASLAYIGLTV